MVCKIIFKKDLHCVQASADHTGPGGVISLRCAKSQFRLNPRTRSIDVLEEEKAQFQNLERVKLRSEEKSTVHYFKYFLR